MLHQTHSGPSHGRQDYPAHLRDADVRWEPIFDSKILEILLQFAKLPQAPRFLLFGPF